MTRMATPFGQSPPRRQWREWTNTQEALDGLSYARFRHELASGEPDHRDQLLAALVAVAQKDTDAVAVVVDCLWPGLQALVARYSPSLERNEATAVGIEALCRAVSDFDTEPVFVASKLLDAAKRRLQHAVRKERRWQQHARDIPDQPAVHEVEGSAAGLLHQAIAAGALSGDDAWLVHTTHVNGHSLNFAARRLGISYEAAKKRRQRASAALAAWLDSDQPPTSRCEETNSQDLGSAARPGRVA